MRLFITGAGGYLGRYLVRYAREAGHECLLAGRAQFDLARPAEIALPPHVDVVVHLAANTRGISTISEEMEIEAARQLLAQAMQQRARFVFVSSQTAQPNAATPYGRVKWHIEQAVLAAGGLVLRPGMIYGGEARGLYGSLMRSCRLPVLPVPVPQPDVQPVPVEACARYLLAMTQGHAPSASLAGTAQSFQSFLQMISWAAYGRAPVFIAVPIGWCVPPLALIGRILPWAAQLARRLRSVATLPVLPVDSSLPHMAYYYRRRLLLWEAHRFSKIFLRRKPDAVLLRSYTKACLRGGQQAVLAPCAIAWLADMPLLASRLVGHSALKVIHVRRSLLLLLAEHIALYRADFDQGRVLPLLHAGIVEVVRILVLLPIWMYYRVRRPI